MPSIEINGADEATVGPIREALKAAEKVRTIRFPGGESAPGNPVLPLSASREGKALTFDGSGEILLVDFQTQVDAKAPLDSATLTGTPTAPTPAEGDDSTKLATTAFVARAAAKPPQATELSIDGSGVATWDPATDGRFARLELTEDVTLEFMDGDPPVGDLKLLTYQDATGGHGLTLPANANVSGTPTTTAEAAVLYQLSFMAGDPTILAGELINLPATYTPNTGGGGGGASITGFPYPGETLDGGATGQWSIDGVDVTGETGQTFVVPYGDATIGDTIEQNGNSVTVEMDYTAQRWTDHWSGVFSGLNATALSAASRSALGSSLTGTFKWIGGVLGPDGKIYGIPFNGGNILIIDPVAGTATRSTMGASFASSEFQGGVLGSDGKIYGMPWDSSDILIIDPVAGTASRSAMGASLSGLDNGFRGGVLGPDGKIYGMPWDSSDILIIDPVAGTATRSAMGASLGGTAKFSGGVLGPDGKIYGVPYNSGNILIIDPIAGTATRSAMGASLSDTGKWTGGVLGPDGKIYGMPWDSSDILIIDPVAVTATRSAMGASLGSSEFHGGVVGPDGLIYGIPRNSSDILIIDPIAGTATRSAMGASLSDTGKWSGGVLAADGRIYGMPWDSNDILIIGSGAGVDDTTVLSAYLNKH